MKKLILIALLFISNNIFAQSIFNPNADAELDIKNAIAKANSEGKNVLIQVGGDWCGWCRMMDKLFNEDENLKPILEENYVSVHVNYSKENKNEKVLKQLDNPNRFGFPVLVILDGNGNRIHTQDTGLLEKCGKDEKGYDMKKLTTFLRQWTVISKK